MKPLKAFRVPVHEVAMIMSIALRFIPILLEETDKIMKAQIVDMSKHFMMIQICDEPEKIKLMIKMLQTISIVEVARTGTVALSKCAENDEG